jgi:hypothetical protein
VLLINSFPSRTHEPEHVTHIRAKNPPRDSLGVMITSDDYQDSLNGVWNSGVMITSNDYQDSLNGVWNSGTA